MVTNLPLAQGRPFPESCLLRAGFISARWDHSSCSRCTAHSAWFTEHLAHARHEHGRTSMGEGFRSSFLLCMLW